MAIVIFEPRTLPLPETGAGMSVLPLVRRSGLAIGVPATTSAPSSTASTYPLGTEIGTVESGDAVDLADDGDTLGHARLEELLDARETHGDVLTGDAARVERTHRELSS